MAINFLKGMKTPIGSKVFLRRVPFAPEIFIFDAADKMFGLSFESVDKVIEKFGVDVTGAITEQNESCDFNSHRRLANYKNIIGDNFIPNFNQGFGLKVVFTEIAEPSAINFLRGV